MPDMVSAFYLPAFTALVAVIGVLWRDNILLRNLLVDLTKSTSLTIEKAAESVRAQTAEMARGRDEAARYIAKLEGASTDADRDPRRPRPPR